MDGKADDNHSTVRPISPIGLDEYLNSSHTLQKQLSTVGKSKPYVVRLLWVDGGGERTLSWWTQQENDWPKRLF